MDHTLLHQSQPSFDFADKFIGQTRSYSNLGYAANDLSFPSRRHQSSLTSGTSGAPLPTNPSLDFNGNSLLSASETPYHQNSHLLLSPPDSTAGSSSTGGNLTTSLTNLTTLPRPFPSNAGPSDHFANAIPPLPSNWFISPMTSMERLPRASPLSPPQPVHSYGSANGIGPPYRGMDRLPHYPTTLPPQISPGSFPPTLRYPPNSYPPRTNGPFPFPISEAHYSGQNMSQDAQSCAGRESGPPFTETHVHHQVLTLRGHPLTPEITATIQKGFFQVDRKWTCYRRNYFSVQCSFSFRNGVAEQTFYLNKNGTDELINGFAVSISAKTASGNGESETRGLVQHTPKRDKATESVPSRQPIAPNTMSPNGTYANPGHVYHSGHHLHSVPIGNYGPFETGGANSTASTYMFERIQFQKATANNGKRRAQQQFFHVVVELSVNVGRQGNDDWVIIATKDSEPMVVRGRSPGHYKDNGRRDSQASMDPDCGTGHGTGGHNSSVSSGSFGHGHSSADWGNYRQTNGHYGGYSYRHAVNSRYSPASLASSNALEETTPEAELSLSDSRTAKSSCTLSSNRSAYTPLSDGSDDVMFSSLDHDQASRKRFFEDDEDGEHLRYPLAGPFTDNLASLANFSVMPSSKLLCASN